MKQGRKKKRVDRSRNSEIDLIFNFSSALPLFIIFSWNTIERVETIETDETATTRTLAKSFRDEAQFMQGIIIGL